MNVFAVIENQPAQAHSTDSACREPLPAARQCCFTAAGLAGWVAGWLQASRMSMEVGLGDDASSVTPAHSLQAVMERVAALELELGLPGSFTQDHRGSPTSRAFEWNSICSGALVQILGRQELGTSALCTSRLYSTGCSGFETVGIGVHCLKSGLRRLNIGCNMAAVAGCVSALFTYLLGAPS